MKELWEVPADKARPGLVVHTAGWPMDEHTYGGGFLYHLEGNKVTLGFVTGLDYQNPWISPFEEMQRWKTHPAIRAHIEGGKRIGYGARAITAGGLLSLPKLVFPGGALVGCEAGTLNAARIKGSHAAIKTGMLVAEAAGAGARRRPQRRRAQRLPGSLREELAACRAGPEPQLQAVVQAGQHRRRADDRHRTVAAAQAGHEEPALDRAPQDARPRTPARRPAQMERIDYPKPDGVLTFDRLSSVFISNTNHEENQPAHLTLKDASVPVAVNLDVYAGPEGRYCPAGVYEFVNEGGTDRLVINAQNCVHCKTCDIKDPTQNIVWVTPEGGGGPNYAGM